MNIPDVGYGLLQQYRDYNAKILTNYIPSINFCEKYEIPLTVNLKQFFEKINDPNNDFVTDLGVQTIPWTGGQAHAYKLPSPTEGYDDE